MRHLYTAAEAQRVLGISAATVRKWASRPRGDGTRALYAFGLDDAGRPMYDRDHLVLLGDRAYSQVMDTPPDLTGARTFREAARPESVDRWHVLPDNSTVVYERTPGEFESSLIAASTLIHSPTWEDVTP